MTGTQLVLLVYHCTDWNGQGSICMILSVLNRDGSGGSRLHM